MPLDGVVPYNRFLWDTDSIRGFSKFFAPSTGNVWYTYMYIYIKYEAIHACKRVMQA